MRLNRRIVISGSIIILLVGAGLLFAPRILWKLGAVLVRDDAPQKADTEVVLGGDYGGRRIMKACELVRQGYAPQAFVSGGGSFWGTHESRYAIDFAARHGCPNDYFVPFEFPAASTIDEATHLIPEFRKRGFHKILVVTSPSHTARAGRIFRRFAPDMEIRTAAASDPRWNGGYWWKTREGRKTWILEFAKTLADFAGI